MYNSVVSIDRKKWILLFLLLGSFSNVVSQEKTIIYSHEVETFNYILGTQTFAPSYQFTDQTELVETAQAIYNMGSNILKTALAMNKFSDMKGEFSSLVDIAREEPSFQKVLDMDFTYYHLWVYPVDPVPAVFYNGLTQEEADNEYQQLYDLTTYLLSAYSNTGKLFYLGNWEGDWHLYYHFDISKPVPAAAVKGMIDWYNIRQRAIDDAKAATDYTGVDVWHYAEIALTNTANKEDLVTVASHVLPYTNVDYVSYSTYDVTRALHTYRDMKKELTSALNWVENLLPPKSDISGKRVWIGEYGYPFGRNPGNVDPKTPAEQDLFARNVMRVGLEWGAPFILWWEMYNNEVKDGRQLGFWLIDDKGATQPIYHTHYNFYQKGKAYVAEFLKNNGRVPKEDEYRSAAEKWLK